jgi:hypothetical protein
MLHPEIARILMVKVSPEPAPRVARALSHAVTRTAVANFTEQAADTGYYDPDAQGSPPVDGD